MAIQFDFAGRCAIVTGAARGIGEATAKCLLAGGAKVAIWDVDARQGAIVAEELSRSGEAVFVAVDQSDSADVERAAQETVAALGGADILVCNAGITGGNATVWDYDPAIWRQVMEVNLLGVYHCCRSVVPIMRKTGWGRIVNVASVAGKEGNPTASAYSASKAGVIALTKSLGKELANTGITVNCITPAAVRTEIFAQMSEEHIQYMLSKIPMGRFGSVEENAHMIAWLCSEEASFSTAAVFDTSGGRATY